LEHAILWSQATAEEVIWSCARCGAGYRDPKHEELLLSAEDRKTVLGYDLFLRLHESRVLGEAPRIQRIEAALGRPLTGDRLLDIGAATGTLGEALGERARYVGLEPDPVLRGRAPASLDLRSCSVQEAALPPNEFDVVVLCDVLEHVPSPTAVLQKTLGWLRPGGLLYVEVPDELHILRRARLRWLLGQGQRRPTHPAHLTLFCEDSLSRCLHLEGLSEIEVQKQTLWGEPARVRQRLPRGARPVARLIALSQLDQRLGLGGLVGTGKKEADRWST